VQRGCLRPARQFHTEAAASPLSTTQEGGTIDILRASSPARDHVVINGRAVARRVRRGVLILTDPYLRCVPLAQGPGEKENPPSDDDKSHKHEGPPHHLRTREVSWGWLSAISSSWLPNAC
jgi:hypothetical protein